MKSQTGIAAVVLLAFGLGWWIGRTTTQDIGGEERIAKLESEIESIQETLAQPPTRSARAAQRRPDPNRAYSVRTASSPSFGSTKASVTFVEFTDYQCPYCGRVEPTLKRLKQEYANDVRFVVKHNPLPIHPKAPAAARAAMASAKQGKFWEMHERIFADQKKLDDKDLRAHAEALGLDLEQWEKDRASSEVAALIAADQAEARRLGATGTPAFFINGRFLSGAQPYEVFKTRIDEELSKKKS